MVHWLEDFAKAGLAPRTYHNYKLQIREHIVPAFGTMKLSKLATPNIRALYSAKLRDEPKPSSVRYIHAVLHRALGKAVPGRVSGDDLFERSRGLVDNLLVESAKDRTRTKAGAYAWRQRQ